MNISKMNPHETQSSVVTFTAKCTDLFATNTYLKDLFDYLAPHAEALQSAVDKQDAEEYTSTIVLADSEFGSAVKTFRSVVSMKGEAVALGDESTACSAIAGVLKGADELEELPRKEQIEVMESIKRLLATDEMIANLTVGGVEKLYAPVLSAHDTLVSLMGERAGVTSDMKEIPSMTDASKVVRPILSKIYKHISDYAEIGNEIYGKLLLDIREELKPIAVQVQSRINRNENESDEQ